MSWWKVVPLFWWNLEVVELRGENLKRIRKWEVETFQWTEKWQYLGQHNSGFGVSGIFRWSRRHPPHLGLPFLDGAQTLECFSFFLWSKLKDGDLVLQSVTLISWVNDSAPKLGNYRFMDLALSFCWRIYPWRICCVLTCTSHYARYGDYWDEYSVIKLRNIVSWWIKVLGQHKRC